MYKSLALLAAAALLVGTGVASADEPAAKAREARVRARVAQRIEAKGERIAKKSQQAAKKAQAPEKKRGAARPGTAGVVEKVDKEAKTITIRAGRKKDQDAKSITVTFNDDTKFLIMDNQARKAKEATLDDVTERKRVRIVTEETGGKTVAKRVTIIERRKKEQ